MRALALFSPPLGCGPPAIPPALDFLQGLSFLLFSSFLQGYYAEHSSAEFDVPAIEELVKDPLDSSPPFRRT